MANDVTDNAIFLYSQEYSHYRFSADHPFDPARTKLTYHLLKALNCLGNSVVLPQPATHEELLLAHRQDYIDFVLKASSYDHQVADSDAVHFGLGTEDTPVFSGMHDSAALVAGGTLSGVKHILSGTASHALNISGGLHHATSGKASGFCIYNDVNIAISYLRKNTDFKVLYIDTDAHHGDGVQWHFYDDSMVCTLSIHETGRYLFPGTGTVRERGNQKGYGYSFNLPVDAYTEDDSFLFVFENALTTVAEYFQPDFIVSQHGADGHFLDHMSHLSLTLKSYRQIPKLVHQIAHKYCDGRWLALGGGGYNVLQVVPRVWSLVWLEMNNWGEKAYGNLPSRWLELVQKNYHEIICPTWEDDLNEYMVIPRRTEIFSKNERTLADALYPITQGKIGNDYLEKLSKRFPGE